MEDVRDGQNMVHDQVQPMGFGGRLINIFTNPTKAFEAIKEKPTWLAPFIIMVLVTLLGVYLLLPHIVEKAVDEIAKNPDTTQEQLQMAAKFIPVSVFGGAFIWVAVWFFLFAAVYLLIGSVFLGGNGKYKQLLGVQAWSSLILVLSSLVTLPIAIIKGNPETSLSLALILPSESIGTVLYNILSQFNFFTIWYLIVFAIGFGIVNNFSRAKSYVTMAVLWVLWVIIFVLAKSF